MPSKSKIKGSTWEREVTKHLTELYGQTFVRVPTSGAYLGGSNNHRATTLDQHQLAAHKGDIQPPTGWRLNIECKNYASIPWHQIIQQDCKQLDSWINQLEQVETPGDVNIAFIKISRQGKYVCVQYFNGLNTTNALQYGRYYVFDLDIFFENNKKALSEFATA